LRNARNWVTLYLTAICRIEAGERVDPHEIAAAPAAFHLFFDMAVDTSLRPTYQTPLADRRVALRFGGA